MDKFSAMGAFVKVVEAGSFAEAARQLGQSRSQINRLVINLEDELSVTLLNRTTRSVSLTPIGAAYWQRAKAILDDLQETENTVRASHDQAIGEIRVNAPMSFGTLHLGPAIADFMKRYPQIRVQLILSDEMLDPVASGFDMTLRIAEPSGSLALIEHIIAPVTRILCCSPAFFGSLSKVVTIDSLKELPCLHYGNLPSGNQWKLTGPDGLHQIRVNGVLCSNNAEVLCQAAVAGLGIALLPTFITGEELKKRRLQTILDDYESPPISLCLLYPPNRHLSARNRLFVKFMQNRFSEQPVWEG